METPNLPMPFPVAASTAPQQNTVNKPAVQQHTLKQSIMFHLFPGVLITLAFIGLAAEANRLELPASLALLTTWLVVGLPLELGILFFQGWRQNGRPSLTNILLYRERVSTRQVLWLVPVLLVWTATVSTLLIPVAEALRQSLFAWWPDWLLLSNFVEHMDRYPRTVLLVMVILSFLLNIAIPSVEELYFRGFLLPRIAHWRQAAPLISVVLFSLYHVWLPWENPTRIIALLPLVYVVQWKRNVYLGIAVHCLLNTIGSLGLLALVLSH